MDLWERGMNRKFISFSLDFKKQYTNRDKKVRNEIDDIVRDLTEIVRHVMKKDLPFKKMKITLRINSSKEVLSVIVMPIPRIIIRRIE